MLIHFLGTRKQWNNGAMDEFKWHELQPNNLLARELYNVRRQRYKPGVETPIDPQLLCCAARANRGGKYPVRGQIHRFIEILNQQGN
jgi:hypothetical protein